jgi:hypothetical protein
VVRRLSAFLGKIREDIEVLFGLSRAEVQEDLGVYWAALNILVTRGELDPATPILVGDHRGNGFTGVMSVQAVLRTVQNGWGRWDRKTEARWRRILIDASERLLYEDAPLSREL